MNPKFVQAVEPLKFLEPFSEEQLQTAEDVFTSLSQALPQMGPSAIVLVPMQQLLAILEQAKIEAVARRAAMN